MLGSPVLAALVTRAPGLSLTAPLAAGSGGFGVPAGRQSARKYRQQRAGRSAGQGRVRAHPFPKQVPPPRHPVAAAVFQE